jgi:acetyl/propionyl-CoA carboxylase alpha subunit
MNYATTINDQTYLIEINDDQHVTVNGVTYQVDCESVNDQTVYSLVINGHSYEAFVSEGEAAPDWDVLIRGALYAVRVEDEREKRLRAAAGAHSHATGEYNLKAPMPGLIVSVPVSEGQTVQKGDILVILESMKMQNELKSQRAGTVTRVRVQPQQSVEQNQILVTVAE